jgi:tetratricopeptide (TPR) repeat protein
LLGAARQGKVLITSRYPLPAGGDWLALEHLGPLSLAETRRLIHRLPALAGGEPQLVSQALRQIGGHPRTLEYLDAILRRDAARLPQISIRLRKQARALGLDPDELGGDFDSAVQDALRIAAADVLLDQLLELVGQREGDLAALYQAAVFAMPASVAELAFALAGAQAPSADQLRAAGKAVQRLVESSLLTPLPNRQVWVHRWTAQGLQQRSAPPEFRERCRRAGETLMVRVATVSHSLGDAVEAVRRFLEAEDFDRATGISWDIVEFLRTYGQVVELAAFLSEVVAALPPQHRFYPGLSREFGDALWVLGFTDQVRQQYQVALDIAERLAAAEPARADYQRDLSVSYERMGDLYTALGQGADAQAAYQRSLDIRERLAAAEPARADTQWDLVVSLWKTAESAPTLRKAYFNRALGIMRRLHAAGSLFPEQVGYMQQLERMLAESK